MNWILLIEIVYITILVLVCLRIIYDTRSVTKTMAYLLFVIFFPVIGMVFYFSFGINYRKRKLYNSKLLADEQLLSGLREHISSYADESLRQSAGVLQHNRELASFLTRDLHSQLTGHNHVKVLLNGEEKFPEMLKAISEARHHIHIEYYIYENDAIGEQLAELLMRKAREGVAVRFIYDDFGSRRIRKKLVPKLKAAGVQAFPFHKVLILLLANRLNYRNHRKVVIVDGQTAFTGGINVSDKYINTPDSPLYWRDTHLRIDGPGVYYLQYLFLCDWRFCSGEALAADEMLFMPPSLEANNTLVQIAASGPDSNQPSILYSLLQAVYLAEKEILITTPYFIPGESMLEALSIAALSGLQVKLLVPGISDSKLVNAAARSYYGDLLDAGVEIYLYKKGFIHAKTMVTDGKLAVIGSANMDYRSFELNFEVNAFVYDTAIAASLRETFFADLQHATRIDPASWAQRALYREIVEKIARLVSPLL